VDTHPEFLLLVVFPGVEVCLGQTVCLELDGLSKASMQAGECVQSLRFLVLKIGLLHDGYRSLRA
jgi:hypothetical protein